MMDSVPFLLLYPGPIALFVVNSRLRWRLYQLRFALILYRNFRVTGGTTVETRTLKNQPWFGFLNNNPSSPWFVRP
jgi:hypothetical protein